jgi:hypothetical protein
MHVGVRRSSGYLPLAAIKINEQTSFAVPLRYVCNLEREPQNVQ